MIRPTWHVSVVALWILTVVILKIANAHINFLRRISFSIGPFLGSKLRKIGTNKLDPQIIRLDYYRLDYYYILNYPKCVLYNVKNLGIKEQFIVYVVKIDHKLSGFT